MGGAATTTTTIVQEVQCVRVVGDWVAYSSSARGDGASSKGTTASTATSTTGLALVRLALEDAALERVEEGRCSGHTGDEDWSHRNDLRNLTAGCPETCCGGVGNGVKERRRGRRKTHRANTTRPRSHRNDLPNPGGADR